MSDVPARSRRIGVYGGAFDPVHLGHLRSALEVRQTLSLSEMRFVPSGTPPHRESARVDAKHRIAMLELAVREAPGVVIDRREVKKNSTSYSIDTLESIAADNPDASLTLVIGMDQFSVFDTWHRWSELLRRFELAVMERPGQRPSETALSILQSAKAATGSGQSAQHIHLISVTQLQISSSRIREDLAGKKDIQFLVPISVRDYIHTHGLYGPGSRSDI